MKKYILTAIAACFILISNAQDPTRAIYQQKVEELAKTEDPKELKKKLKDLQKSKKEGDLILVLEYFNTIDDIVNSEKLKAKIKKQFPKGHIVFQSRLADINVIADLDEKDKAVQELKKDFPEQSYFMLGSQMAQQFASRGNEEKMKEYVDMYASSVSDGKGNKISTVRLYGQLAPALVQKNPNAALKYLAPYVAELKKSYEEELKKEPRNEGLIQRSKTNYYMTLNHYLSAQLKGGDKVAALEEIKKYYFAAKEDASTSDGILKGLENVYTQALIQNNLLKEAFPYLEQNIVLNGATEELKQNLKAAYTVVNGNAVNFDTYYTELLKKQEAHFLAEVQKKAIMQPSHDFTLQDVDGNTVTLSELKGKVVVLDFWATWCGPCKASFPGMQKAVNKFKDDDQVRFLFLHTWEKGGGDATVGAKKYVTDNNYSFEVLMDLRNKETNESAVAKAYKVSGIPTKIIIDVNGNIRFNTSGFSADEDKAVKELSTMIEVARRG